MSDPKFKHVGDPVIRLMEECAELISAIAKAERFGWRNWHPETPGTDNLMLIQKEMEDVAEAYADLMKTVLEQRKKLMAEWKEIHPEGITAANHEELKKFIKRREREIKAVGEEEKP